MRKRFDRKEDARQAVWDALQEEGAAAFPFPPHGRIPNFKGAADAAERLFDHEPWASARALKINPDAPQIPVRRRALERGCLVCMPTPRLRDGFLVLDPADIPDDRLGEAATLSKCDRWARAVALDDLPRPDAIVCGSVAVTRDGRRCGKGEGYSDIEYAVLRELGREPVPVATTVHPLQVVERLPRDPHDTPLDLIATPDDVLEVEDPPEPPAGIAWDALDDEDLEAMPVLRDLRDRGGD